jgi:hypothetical protein
MQKEKNAVKNQFMDNNTYNMIHKSNQKKGKRYIIICIKKSSYNS